MNNKEATIKTEIKNNMPEETIKLTQHAHGAGCGCKIAPQVLDEILKSKSAPTDFKALLVGNSAKDDAAVYQLNETEALIATTDFFTPIVDDPYIFGKVAAANAISDVYAMGGEPLLALAILGWPIEKLPVVAAQQVLEGARAVCAEAHIPLAGGHSIDTPEPVFGLSVNGKVMIKHLKQNNKAQAGDLLLLTKAIGVGVLSTAAKRGVIEEKDAAVLEAQLVKLNSIGALLGKMDALHAMTDITGFGIAGHLVEMAEGSGLSAVLEYAKVPKLEGLNKYLDKNIIPDATYRNWNSFSEKVEMAADVNMLEAFRLLPDPQTNGGLLISVAPQGLDALQQLLAENGYEDFVAPIGRMEAKGEKVVFVR